MEREEEKPKIAMWKRFLRLGSKRFGIGGGGGGGGGIPSAPPQPKPRLKKERNQELRQKRRQVLTPDQRRAVREALLQEA